MNLPVNLFEKRYCPQCGDRMSQREGYQWFCAFCGETYVERMQPINE